MQPNNEIKQLLNQLELKYLETILDRRGTLALQVLHNEKPAILKLENEEITKEAEHKASLLLPEANLLSKIPHLTNNLYLKHGFNDNKNWLLLREVKGDPIGSITKKIREQVVDPKEKNKQLLDVIVKISKFFSKLYENSYLHGDIQPAHIFSEENEITVIDWGLARSIAKPNPFYKGGFIYFVAPEIAEKMGLNAESIEYTPHAEVYALGITLFMIYTGHLPINFGPTEKLKELPMAQKIKKVLENKILSFEELELEPQPELEQILRKSLSANPKKRFENPSFLYENLKRIN